MKQAKNVKVGSVVQIPITQFAPQRKGWNGWIFRAAIVNKLYVSKAGIKCANVTYCTKRAGRYQLLPNEEKSVNMKCCHLFEYNVEMQNRAYQEFKAIEDAGEMVCWDEDTALLVNHGILK